MKVWIHLTLGALLLTCAAQAQLNKEDYGAQALLIPAREELFNPCPYAINCYTDVAGKANFRHEHCKENLKTVQFAIAEVDVGRMICYNSYCDEGLILTAGYNFMYLNWKNPFIDQSSYNTLSLALAGFSHRVCDWVWEGEVRLNATLDDSKFYDYLTVDMILAGRYAWNECLGIHAGFIALTGMRIDHVYPVIGIDWRIDDRWMLNLVFPLNLSLMYCFNTQWSMGIAGRFFDERHRVGENQTLSRGLVEYRSGGVEFDVNFVSCDKNLQINVHGGGLLGGRVKVSNSKHHDSSRFRFNAAPYAGADVAWRF